jgi:hypothetical protein
MQGSLPAHERVTIAHLELAALLLNLGVMIEQAALQGKELDGQAVLALADNSNTISWVRKAGAKDARAARLMVMLGLAEIDSGFSTLVKHIPGIDNTVADAATRLSSAEVQQLLLTTPCPITLAPTAWTQVSPPRNLLTRVESVLEDFTRAQHSLPPPGSSTTAPGTCGRLGATCKASPLSFTPTTSTAAKTQF